MSGPTPKPAGGPATGAATTEQGRRRIVFAWPDFEPDNLFADLTVSNFVLHNLIPVTIGNIIGGGVMVGLTYWFIFRRHH